MSDPPDRSASAEPGPASERMAQQAVRDTAPELQLRSELFRRGMRYRVHRRPLDGLRRQADIVFTRSKVAVFVDGCFWHGCPEHGTDPKRNAEFWKAKIDGNRARDRDTDKRLAEAGWTVIRVWEHEDAVAAADRVEQALRIDRSN